jgi:hypothetical protein
MTPDQSIGARLRIGGPSVWREWSAGCNCTLPIMIMDYQKSPQNLPEEYAIHPSTSALSLLA